MYRPNRVQITKRAMKYHGSPDFGELPAEELVDVQVLCALAGRLLTRKLKLCHIKVLFCILVMFEGKTEHISYLLLRFLFFSRNQLLFFAIYF